MRSYAQNMVQFTLSFMQSRLGLSFLFGWICGLYLLSTIQRFQTFTGESNSVIAGLGLSIVIGLWLGMPAPAVLNFGNASTETHLKSDHKRIRFTLILLSIWTLCFPVLLWQYNSILHLVSTQQMENQVFLTGLMTLSAMTLILPVVYWSTRLCWLSIKLAAHQVCATENLLQVSFSRYLTGMALALFAAAYWIVPALGWSLTLGLTGGVSLLYCLHSWIGRLFSRFLPGSTAWFKMVSQAEENQEESNPAILESFDATVTPLLRAGSYLVSLAAGVFLVTMDRVAFQLFPDSLFLKITVWAAFLAGNALVFSRIRISSTAKAAKIATRVSIGLAVVGVGTLALFPLFVNSMLYANAYIEYAALLALVRGGLIASLFFPLGCCWGMVLKLTTIAQPVPGHHRLSYQLPLWQPFSFLAGILFCSWLIGTVGTDLKWVSVLTAGGLFTLVLLIWGSQFSIPRTRWQVARVSCGLAVFLMTLLNYKNYDPQHATKLLFSTSTFTGLRYGLKPELLPYMDEGRCLSEVEGPNGTFTLWSYHENQLQVRRSGLPLGVTTTDAGLCPHTTGELMPFVIPVILHERPSDVLFLGLGAGVGVNSSLDFPVQRVTCLEQDSGLVELYQQEIASRNSISALDSDRVHLAQVPVALAMAARTQPVAQYDLIISNPAQSVVTQSQSEYTAEFYRNVSRHLNEGGIFCQRFQHVDFGAQPIRVIAQTFLAEFEQVLAIEIANGETLFLGTNSEQGFIRPQLLDRLQAPQVRRTLAQVGWDWSVLLNLAAYSGESLQKMVADVPTSVNSATTGTFAFSLAYEMMRWGPKREEVQQMVSKDNRTGRLINWMDADKNDPIVLRRLSEVTAQNKLMVQYPDQYWKYRKPAKEQITDNPRSLIKQVAAESTREDDFIHNEDKRRMLYFKALSDAMSKPSPSVELIGRVSRFTSTYDPMITYFMHDEVAELYRKSEDTPPNLEFAHRLHAINYGAVADRSINSVIRALELAATEPEMFQQKGEQWDHLNGLLQALKTRWDNRSQAPPVTSKQALHDIEISISAIELAFETMGEIHEGAGVSQKEWRLRKQVLDRTLVRPLQTYHTRVLPHHYKKAREERKKLLENLNLPKVPTL